MPGVSELSFEIILCNVFISWLLNPLEELWLLLLNKCKVRRRPLFPASAIAPVLYPGTD
jgi:hypothetical protein